MVVGGRAATLLPLNLPHLQNLIKRDKDSYRPEFLLQQAHFYSTLDLMQASGWEINETGGGEESFENLITFMSHVVPCYVKETKGASSSSAKKNNVSTANKNGPVDESVKFVTTVMDLLEKDAAALPAALRRCLCQALILMRSKRGIALVPTERMLMLFFRLFGLKDKQLRSLLYEAIVADIRKANHPHRNNALNRTLQNFMYSIFSSNSNSNSNTSTADEMTATKSLQVIIELHRRSIWNDSKTVNIIAEAALKGNCPKTMVMALNFFLGKYPGAADIGAEDNDGDEETSAIDPKSKAAIATSEEYRMLLHACQVGGVSKAKKNRLKRILASDHKKTRGSDSSSGASSFSPLSLVNDPQGFAERLYRQLKGSNAAFEIKLLMINVLSRFIGWHKLLVLDFYSFLLRYLQPHQRAVTQILAYTAQATHALIPPDTLYPVIRAIADNFVSEGAAEAVVSAGLNGIREICTRSPHAMTETLLNDLTDYKKGGDHKNKGVMMAARSLIALFRELNPELLHRRDRGRDISIAMAAGKQKKALTFGQTERVEGEQFPLLDRETVELEELEEEVDSEDDGEEEDFESFEECSDDEDDGEDSEGEEEEIDSGSDLEEAEEDCPELAAAASTDVAVKVGTKRVRYLPTERILLPEDYAPKKVKKVQKYEDSDDNESESESETDSDDEPSTIIDPSKIEGYKSKAKADYEARLASIHAGREGREKFGTRKRGNSRSSTTNKEKSKGKNFLMMAHKFEVKGKKRRSLKQRQAVQKKHTSTMKRRH